LLNVQQETVPGNRFRPWQFVENAQILPIKLRMTARAVTPLDMGYISKAQGMGISLDISNSSVHPIQEISTGNLTLIHVSIIGRTGKVGNGNEFGSVQAEDCVLQYCVQAIQSNFTSGVFSEKILANFTQWASSYDPSLGAIETYFTEQSGTPSGPKTNFTIDPSAFSDQQDWLELLLNVQVWDNYIDDLYYNGTTPGAVDAIYSNGIGNYSSTINAMAESLTTHMRVAPSVAEGITGLTNKTTGVALKMVVIVHVEWFWLILPAIVEVGGVIFVIATILLSSRSKAKLWKTSVLPLLFHGLESDLRKNTGVLRSCTEWRKRLRIQKSV
jgi:hypothetical protein